MIADFHERRLPELTARDAELPSISGKIDAVIGMRRSGKTSRIHQQIGALIGQGVPKAAMLYINFDDERLAELGSMQLGLIHETYFRMFPEHKERRCYFFFDEIQNVEGWERYLRRLMDSEDVQLTVTGSSAKLLSKEIATALRGRAITTEIFPFSFREALRHEGIAVDKGTLPGSAKRALLENRMRNYLETGGFPEVQGLDSPYRIRVLQEYVDVVILRDVIERHRITNVLALRYLLRHLLASPATLFSVNKFYHDLKSQGIACSKTLLHELLTHLQDSYLIYAVPIHASSERARRVNPRKVYCVDSGIASAFARSAHADRGRVLENMVMMELRRRGGTIEYVRTASGYAVDFLVTLRNGEQRLLQVSLSLQDAATRKQELRALHDAMGELGLSSATIITLEEEALIEDGARTIRVLPAWRWVLFDAAGMDAANVSGAG